jgi:hypothetical protein
MSSNSIRALLEKQGRANGTPPLGAPAQEREAEYQPFANGRIGNQPQLTLVFRKKDGSVHGFSYSYFYSIESDNPDAGFTVDFSNAKVEVTGHNLEHLFRLVCQHRAAEIIEANRNHLLQKLDTEPAVERISLIDK